MSSDHATGGKAARVARSRAACSGCRQTKQRCDGPSRIPCRRCELYGLECEYPPSSGPATSKPARKTEAHHAAPHPHPPAQPSQMDALMSASLKEIAERLRAIEVSIETSNHHHSSPSSRDYDSPPAIPSFPPRNSSEDGASSRSATNGDADAGHLTSGGSNPLQTVMTQISMIESIAREKSSPMDGFGDWSSRTNTSTPSLGLHAFFGGLTTPDAITRGILTAEECEASFEIFFSKMQCWTMFLDDIRDRQASAVRERHPLLFHVILLTTSYYLMGSSTRGAQVYYALTSLVNELLAPLIISSQSHQINSDFVRALCLMVLYKPVQHAALYAQGITDPDAAEQACKLNNFSSSILSGVMTRTAQAIHLSTAPNAFSKAFSPTIAIAPSILSDLRLWYWICCVDAQGALSYGRACVLDMGDAVRTTRLFASLKTQVADVRLAATVELYSTVRAVVNSMWATGSKTIGDREIRRFNQNLDEWEAYWTEPIQAASLAGDQLAETCLNLFANFIRLAVNTSVFSRWRTDRQASLARGGTGRPELTANDWKSFELGLAAAEKLVFSLSLESRVDGSPYRRAVKWGPGVDFVRPALHLDPFMVDLHKTAFDNITCVVYIYSLIVVAKMANTGLIRCELDCRPIEYAAGTSGKRPQRLISGAKLARLLELGASFLDAIAPTPSHPARKHARMLRAIVAAGTQGQVLLPTGTNSPTLDLIDVNVNTAGDEVIAALQELHRAQDSPSLTAASTDESETFDPTYSLPPQPTSFTQPRIATQDEPGEALAAVLGGLSPTWLSQIGYFDVSSQEGFDSNMVVDWASLEKSMDLQRAQEPSFAPLDAGFFGLSSQTA